MYNDLKRIIICCIGFVLIFSSIMPVTIKQLVFILLGGTLLMASGLFFPPKK